MTPPPTRTIATIGGDGIGPEVVRAAVPVIEAAAARAGTAISWEHLPHGADHYLRTGETLSDEVFAHLRDDVDAIFVGALGDPRVPGNEHAKEILLGLRFRLDLYVNFRPVRLLHPRLCALRASSPPSPPPHHRGRDGEGGGGGRDARHIDFAIFRENTEGAYRGEGTSEAVGTPGERQISYEIHTAAGVSRILRAAFEWAVAGGRTRITMSDKSNAIPQQRIWQRLFQEIGEEYPGIEREHRYVDALAMELVREPERFQVIVTNNLYGDILSDLAAGLVGGLGVAASANLHPGRPGLFEPVHGSAPPLAGKGVANPMAAILAGALMLDELGLPDAAQRLETAVAAALDAGEMTPDLGGTRTTGDVAEWIGLNVSG